MTRSVTARWAAGAVLLCASGLTTACGSVTQGGSAPPGSTPASSPAVTQPGSASSSASAAASARSSGSGQAAGCASPGLKVKVDTGQSGATAGSVYYPIDFTNTSGSSCTLLGFPGVSFVTRPSGSMIGQPADRNSSAAAADVTLSPGGDAHAVLQVVDAGNYTPSDCHPVTAHWLRVYPPGQTAPLYASFSSRVCSADMSAKLGSSLSIYPVRGGAGKAGQAP